MEIANPKIKAKVVGSVDILEFWGQWHPQRLAEKAEPLKEYLKDRGRHVLLNLSWMNQVNRDHFEYFEGLFKDAKKRGVLMPPYRLQEVRVDWIRQHRFEYLTDEKAATCFFQWEFAEDSTGTRLGEERRGYVRLRTVLPLTFWFEDRLGQRRDFFAVVTNLSEGGLYAEFIESVSESRMKNHFDPYELPLIHMNLFLTLAKRPLAIQGKVVYGNFPEEGIGIQFYEDHPETRDYLAAWLEAHAVSMDTRNHRKGE